MPFLLVIHLYFSPLSKGVNLQNALKNALLRCFVLFYLRNRPVVHLQLTNILSFNHKCQAPAVER